MHTNPETLALLALGEDVASPDERQHVTTCPDCSHELLELERLTDLGRAATEEPGLSRPAPHVWDQLRVELGFAGDTVQTASPLPVGPIMTRPATPDQASPDRTVPDEATVVPLKPREARRSRSLRLMAVAAALALVAGIGIGLGIDRLRQPTETVVASGQLVAFPGYPNSSGEAKIETDNQGNRTLVVSVSNPNPAQDLVVWMMDPTFKEMRTMGFIRDGYGRFPIPQDMSLSKFPVVDISDEPLNEGNPAHSGNTVVRGDLDI